MEKKPMAKPVLDTPAPYENAHPVVAVLMGLGYACLSPLIVTIVICTIPLKVLAPEVDLGIELLGLKLG